MKDISKNKETRKKPQSTKTSIVGGAHDLAGSSRRKKSKGTGAFAKAQMATDVPQNQNTDNGKPERIAKRMARAGLCSRREAEVWIKSGRVTLNGKPLDTPAVTVSLADRVEVDGNPLPGRERTRLWLYHKPAGLLTTNSDPQGRATIFEQLPIDLPRLLSVGRLDMSTEGLLLMTNDGGLARILELPSTGWLRRYRVRAHGKVDPDRLEGLKDGIAVDGVLYGSIEANIDREQGSNTWLNVSIREGKNREVKNVLGALGLEVNRLIRISYGPFQLGSLGAREIQEIRGRLLRDQLGERLIKEAGADFDAPIHHQPTTSKSNSQKNDSGNNLSERKPGQKIKAPNKQRKRKKSGAISDGTMDRLETRNKSGSDNRQGRNSTGNSRANSRRKSK